MENNLTPRTYHPWSGQRRVQMVAVGLVVVVVISFLVIRFGFGGKDTETDTPIGGAGPLPVRRCYSTESVCPGGEESGCSGLSGGTASPTAKTTDGEFCCRYGCADEPSIPVRPCRSTEHICDNGQACLRPGGGTTTPRAISPSGKSCCLSGCA
jgi:hypothetical protein